MFLSIIIPIYNDEKYLEECLDSCLHQDIPYDDYEIICVDDGSTDRTPEILRDYASRYPNIQLMLMERHHGGRTVGYRQAQGEYIWFVDHDDFIEENILSAMKEQLSQKPCSRLTFPAYEFYNALTDEELSRKATHSLEPNAVGGKYSSSNIWTALFNHAFMLRNDVTPSSKWRTGLKEFWGGDTFFSFEMSMGDGYQEVHWGDRPCYYYRRHKESETGSSRSNAYPGLLNYATAALRAAVDSKEKMLDARSRGADAAPDAARMLVWMRLANVTLVALPKAHWKEGKKRIKDAGMDRVKQPPEYHPSYKNYLMHSGEKKGLKSYLSFRAYHLAAAKLLRIIDVKSATSRFISRHSVLRKWNTIRHRVSTLKKGLRNSSAQ